LLTRPELTYNRTTSIDPNRVKLPTEVIEQVEIQIKYAGYIKRQNTQVKRYKKLENYIKLLGPISHNQILSYYQNSDLFINLSHTGSMDKVVLEAMACEKLVLTCNEAFFDFLNDQRFIFQKKKSSRSDSKNY